MVVWTSRGWVGFLYILGCLIGGMFLTDSLLGEGTWESNVWPKFAALLVCSALCWVTGRPLNRGLPPRVLAVPSKLGSWADPSLGHTLAFVRLEYAGLVALPLYLFIAIEEAGWL